MVIKKICFIAVYDSYLKSLMPLLRFFNQQNIETKLLVAETIAERVISEVVQDVSYEKTAVEKFHKAKFNKEYDVIFIGAGGSDLKQICRSLRDCKAILVSLFPGVTGTTIYQGFNDRAGSDIILLNNAADFKKYEKYAADFKLNCQPFMLGFPNLAKLKKKSGDDIVFFDQNFPTMSFSEKAYIFDKLIAIAKAKPDRSVIIKLRNKPGENTPHTSKTTFEDLFAKVSKKSFMPKNLRLSYESIEEVLRFASLGISVSSAAIVETLYNGVSCAIISDFGIRPEFGNDVFIGSELYASFDEILADEIPQVNPNWYEEYIVPAENNCPALLKFLKAYKPQARKTHSKKPIMKEITQKKNVYGGRQLKKEIALRKYKKFKNSPRLFFSDSKNPIVRISGKFLGKF